MKKRNIVRFTAFIMAMLMCTSSAVTLFAEGVDSTEDSVIEATESVTTEATESASEAITEDETKTQTVSGNETTPTKPTRSELGQKILEFKNSDDINEKKLFSEWGYSYDNEENPTEIIGFNSPEIQLTCIDGDLFFRVYKKSTDTLLYTSTREKQSADGSIYIEYYLTDNSDLEELVKKDDIPTLDLSTIVESDYEDLYFVFYNTNKEMMYVVTYKDSIRFADFIRVVRHDLFESPIPTDNSTFTVSLEPVVKNESTAIVNFNLNFNIDLDYSSPRFDFKFNKGGLLDDYPDRKDKLVKITILDSDFDVVTTYNVNKLDTGNITVPITTGINGDYHYKLYSLFGYTWEGSFTIDAFKEKADVVVTEEELKAATVSFSGMPDKAYTNDSVTLKMNTDKRCKMSFNGVSLANNEYATSADFTVTHNGTYSYTAINEQGVAINGTFEVTFFKDKIADAINDPLQSDLVSAKTDTTLSQTGLYQIWLIILAVVLCSFGILLIVNQKYHFLDKFVRRLKHESN